LALIAPHFVIEEMGLLAIARTRADYDHGGLKVRLGRWHRDVDNAFIGWSDAWLDPKFGDWDISEYLRYIRVPIAILQGADDQYGTLRQVEIAEQECSCPVDVAIIPNAAHSPYREAPEVTLAATADFINRVLRTHGEGRLERAA
jgi:pimeloyl-ACP methyl ester carboxylesterase